MLVLLAFAGRCVFFEDEKTAPQKASFFLVLFDKTKKKYVQDIKKFSSRKSLPIKKIKKHIYSTAPSELLMISELKFC